MRSPVEALPCGSRSMIRTRSPMAASAVPRLMAVVVFPTPPFWLARASTRGRLPFLLSLIESIAISAASVWLRTAWGLWFWLDGLDHDDPGLRIGFAHHS